MNPEKSGFDLAKSADGTQEFVTLQGKVVTLPKTVVTDKELEKRLFRARSGNEGTIKQTGEHLVNGNNVAYYEEVDEPGLNAYCSKMTVENHATNQQGELQNIAEYNIGKTPNAVYNCLTR